ncbi:MAG: hypothetical protein AAFR52_15645 [Pseudomonadota bacterium]
MQERPGQPPATGLDALDTGAGIAGSEGLDVNYLSRIRIHFLVGQHQSLIAQMQFADAKAAALMTVIGLLAMRGPLAPGAALSAALSGGASSGASAGASGGASSGASAGTGLGAALLPAPGALAAVATILSLAVLVVCIAAIVPRFPAAGLRRALWREDRFSWPALAGGDYGPGEFARFMRTAEASQMVCSLARSNAACATILLGKYRLLRLAFALALVQFVLLGAVIGLG